MHEEQPAQVSGIPDGYGVKNPADCGPYYTGGELRRMAIARALAQDAPVILADEPTGDLDEANTALVMSILRAEAEAHAKIVVLSTHEPAVRVSMS